MIVVKVRGGLGNQFFQYACGRRLALLRGSRVKIDPSLWMAEPRHHDRPLRLWDFMIDADMVTAQELATLDGRLAREEPFGFHPETLRLPDDVILEGYWQSESYFADAAVMIRRDFRFRDDTLAARARATIAAHREQGSGPVVAVHVRRGDYAVEGNAGLFHVLSAGWYHNAMDRFPAGTRFLVFSDDLPWCQANLNRPGLVYAQGGSDLADFALLRACDHYIVANSSFSWWAAYLSDNETAQVIAPTAEFWFGARLAANDASNIIPSRWIRQPDTPPAAPAVAAPAPVTTPAAPVEPTPAAADTPANAPAAVEAQLARILLKERPGTALRLRPGSPDALPDGQPGVTWLDALPGQGLDAWRAATGRRHLHLVSADLGAWAATALESGPAPAGAAAGAEATLRHGRIDYLILHNPARPGQPAGITLPRTQVEAMVAQLTRWGYRLFQVDGLQLHGGGDPIALLRRPGTVLAVQERLLPLLGASPMRELDLGVLCWGAGIKPRGIIHVGTHEGQTLDAYQRLGIASVLFVEANPTLHGRLSRQMDGMPGVRVVHRAIGDQDGVMALRTASFEQTGSVRVSTLDGLVAELGLDPSGYNLLHLDTQGAEGLALKGATRLLSGIEGVRVGLDFAGTYADGLQIEDTDAILTAQGFTRKAMLSGHHEGWADGFYCRMPAQG